MTVVPALLLATSFEFVYFSLAGMETALLAVILAGDGARGVAAAELVALPVLGAGRLPGPSGSGDGLSVVPGDLVGERGHFFDGGTARGRKRAVSIAYPVCWFSPSLSAAVTAARLAYFHDIVPNTFHAKPSDAGLVVANAYGLLMGENSNVAFPVTGWLAIAVLALGYVRLRRAAAAAADMLAAICTSGIIFGVYSPADWTALPRYFAPYLPAALILLWAGLIAAANAIRSLPHWKVPRFALVGIAAVLLASNIFHSHAKLAAIGDFPGYVLAGKNLVGPAVWMGDHLPSNATIATRRIGAVAYYSRRQVFDYSYGLTDVEVARLVARHGGRFETPTDPALADVWRARPPEYFLEDSLIMDYILGLSGGTRQRFLIHDIPYHMIRQFPIGDDSRWILAQRMK